MYCLYRETVLEMLIQQDVGAFVVRDSTTHAGCYALSIRVPKYENESGISHYLITRTPRGTVKLKV
jgi:tensin